MITNTYKVEILEHFDVPRMPASLGMDLEGFSRYIGWTGRDRKLVEKYVRNAFEQTIKAKTGYSDETRPPAPVTGTVSFGDIEFLVTTSPTTKRPSYEKVIAAFEAHLRALAELYGVDRLGQGYRTLKNRSTDESEQYVLLRLIVDYLNDQLSQSLEGKEGVKHDIELERPETLKTEVPDTLQIVNRRDYSTPVQLNANTYVLARNLTVHNDSVTKAFKDVVLDDTLAILNGEPEFPTALVYPFDRAVFIHQVEPRENTSYANIFDGFVKKAPKTLRTNSRVGDFELLGLISEGARDTLIGKGLVDDSFLGEYDMQVRDGEPFVRLTGLRNRLGHHKNQNTTTSIEQNITMQPPNF